MNSDGSAQRISPLLFHVAFCSVIGQARRSSRFLSPSLPWPVHVDVCVCVCVCVCVYVCIPVAVRVWGLPGSSFAIYIEIEIINPITLSCQA